MKSLRIHIASLFQPALLSFLLILFLVFLPTSGNFRCLYNSGFHQALLAQAEDLSLQQDAEVMPEIEFAETDTTGAFPETAETVVSEKSFRPEAQTADSVVSAETTEEVRKLVPFYLKWWFSLLVVLLTVPFIYRYFSNREKKWDQERREFEQSINSVKQLVNEKVELLKKQEYEFNKKLVEEEELKFHAVGLSKFSELISNNREEEKSWGIRL